MFKDFGTPLRPENPIPYVNQKGLVAREGNPKDVYYLFQTYQTQTPVCYIESPCWKIRTGEDGECKRIRVISNCQTVELIVNGVSFGTKNRNPQEFPAGGLVWFVPYSPGKNKILAIGMMHSGECVEHLIEQEYYPRSGGEPLDFIWNWDCVAHEKKIIRLTIQLVDSQNIPVLEDERRVRFSMQSGGHLLGLLGTLDGSQEIETANGSAEILIAAEKTTVKLKVQISKMSPRLILLNTETK